MRLTVLWLTWLWLAVLLSVLGWWAGALRRRFLGAVDELEAVQNDEEILLGQIGFKALAIGGVEEFDGDGVLGAEGDGGDLVNNATVTYRCQLKEHCARQGRSRTRRLRLVRENCQPGTAFGPDLASSRRLTGRPGHGAG